MIRLPELAPDAFLTDKGYDVDAIRADLTTRNIEAIIPRRSNRRVKIDYDRMLYKQRDRIERMFGQLKIKQSHRHLLRRTGCSATSRIYERKFQFGSNAPLRIDANQSP